MKYIWGIAKDGQWWCSFWFPSRLWIRHCCGQLASRKEFLLPINSQWKEYTSFQIENLTWSKGVRKGSWLMTFVFGFKNLNTVHHIPSYPPPRPHLVDPVPYGRSSWSSGLKQVIQLKAFLYFTVGQRSLSDWNSSTVLIACMSFPLSSGSAVPRGREARRFPIRDELSGIMTGQNGQLLRTQKVDLPDIHELLESLLSLWHQRLCMRRW